MDKSSLISIPVSNNYNMEPYCSKFKLTLVNTQSIKNKDHLISNLLEEQNIDISAGIETWLTDRTLTPKVDELFPLNQ